jgi:hypothetical protein
MANPVGSMYVSLDLDATKYTKAQKAILKGAEKNSADINKVHKTVGITSDAMYDAMRKNVENALNAIKRSHISSKDEIVRAEKSAADKIKQINEQQHGKQVSLIQSLKNNWIAASAAAVAAYMAVKKAIDVISDVTLTAARYETLGVVMRVVGNNAGYTGEQMEKFAAGLEKAGISIVSSDESRTWCPPAWLDNIYDDYERFCKSPYSLFTPDNKDINIGINPVYQGRCVAQYGTTHDAVELETQEEK